MAEPTHTNTRIAAVVARLNDWRWPITALSALCVVAFLALGFGVFTPQGQFMALQAQDAALVRTDSLNRKEILDSLAAIRTVQRRQDVVLTGTGLYRCTHSTEQELQLYRMKKWCDEELGNR